MRALAYALKTFRERHSKCRVLRYDGRQDGNPFFLVYSPNFGPSLNGESRFVVSLGFYTKRALYSLMINRYSQGYELNQHTDGVERNDLLLLEVWRAKRGGVFSAGDGSRSWLGGRLWRLDAGAIEHGFSKIEEGSRLTVILQRGQEDGKAP